MTDVSAQICARLTEDEDMQLDLWIACLIL
jgi:hypothetical protein